MVTTLPPVKIVYASTWFGSTKFGQEEDIGYDCPIPEGYSFDLTNASSWCTITSSHDDIDSASGLIFHAPDSQFGDVQPQQSLEAPFSSLFRANPTAMKAYNYIATYNFKSTFLFSYFSPSIMDVANRPLPKDFIKTKTKAAPILWIAKNCGATNGRQHYIRKLMEHVDVHSYGACLHNKFFPKDKSRMELMAEYKFYLAIENSNCDDYATEKLADTIAMSAVSIVDGPPSYEGLIPSNRSVIHMDAYPDPKDLADYIKYLDGNDTAYLEYLAFRRDAINIPAKERLEPAFISNWSDTIFHKKRSSYCSVCRGLVPWWEAKTKGYTYHEPNKDVFLADQSCSPPGKWNYIVDGPPYKPNWIPRPRDEFTRPDFYISPSDNLTADDDLTYGVPYYDSLPNNLPQSSDVLKTDKPIKRTTVLAANVSFVLLFLVFIAFLIKQSRKHNNSTRYQDTDPIV